MDQILRSLSTFFASKEDDGDWHILMKEEMYKEIETLAIMNDNQRSLFSPLRDIRKLDAGMVIPSSL